MKKILLNLLMLVLAFSLSMCKNQDNFSKEFKSEIKNSYKFNGQIESIIYKDSLNPNFEYAATLYALKSSYKKALSIWDSIPKNQQRLEAIDTNFIENSYRVLPARDYIIEKSGENSLVILNEAHHNNSHRVFAESLLTGLYKNGYKLLFLETLSNGKYADTLLNQRGYPVDASGFYSSNPQFGNFIRKALSLGFKIFPYETTATSDNIDGKMREMDQANNIVTILRKYPQEKALIYVGYGHNREGKVPYWDKAMAERVKELTGIDPLTISQDKFSEKSSKSLSNPLLVKLDLKEPSVLVSGENIPYKTATDSSWTDIAVFHPFTTYRNGRPDWLFYDGKKNVSINLSSVQIDFPIMLMGYNNKEEMKINAVPLDMAEIENKEEKATLVLHTGKYVIKAINENDVYQLLEITVD